MPEVNINVGNRFTSVDVDELNLNIGIDTLLTITEVKADVFAIDI